jgi:hypothetical protein
MSNQQPNRQNTFGNQDPSNRLGVHDMSPRFARMTEVGLAQIAAQEALRTLHGVHVAAAAGAAVGAESLQNPVAAAPVQSQQEAYLNYIAPDKQPEFVPASQEVQAYGTTQPGFVPQSPEVQSYAAQAAMQPVPAPASISAQQGF